MSVVAENPKSALRFRWETPPHSSSKSASVCDIAPGCRLYARRSAPRSRIFVGTIGKTVVCDDALSLENAKRRLEDYYKRHGVLPEFKSTFPEPAGAINLPDQPAIVTQARTSLQGALGISTTGIADTYAIVERRHLNNLLEWLNTLDTLAGVK